MKSTLAIKDFKGLEEIKVPLTQLTVLAGINSVGKSSIIQSLLLARFAFDEHLNSAGSIVGQKIPVNGPFLLELGNTAEVIRRGKKVEENNFTISSIGEQGEEYDLKLSGETANYKNYELTVDKAEFKLMGSGLLASSFYYLAAERIGPRLKHEYVPTAFAHVGYRGERTFQILSGNNNPTDERRNFKKEDPALLFPQVDSWLNYIIPDSNFKNAELLGRSGVIEGTYGDSLPPNVGFGISYVMPIIVNGLLADEGSYFIVENPEAHLHPSGQSRIGEFLSRMAASGLTVIVETHSEHVINGIRIASLKGAIDPNSVSINFLKRSIKGSPELQPISLNEQGDLSDYPEGFFDQEERDLALISRLRREKKNG